MAAQEYTCSALPYGVVIPMVYVGTLMYAWVPRTPRYQCYDVLHAVDAGQLCMSTDITVS